MGGPATEVGAVVSRVEFVHMGRGHTERSFDDGCSDVAYSAVVVAIHAQLDVVPKADKPDESLNDSHGARDMAGGRGTGIAGALALFAVLPIFVCAILDEGTSNRRASWVKFEYLV